MSTNGEIPQSLIGLHDISIWKVVFMMVVFYIIIYFLIKGIYSKSSPNSINHAKKKQRKE